MLYYYLFHIMKEIIKHFKSCRYVTAKTVYGNMPFGPVLLFLCTYLSSWEIEYVVESVQDLNFKLGIQTKVGH